MAGCELCGKKDSFSEAIVEGVLFTVCSSCSKYGNVIDKPKPVFVKKQKVKTYEFSETVLENFGMIIKSSRESFGLSQNELAHKINEKESLLTKIEQGSIKPDIEFARKLENFFKIKLISKEKIDEPPAQKIQNKTLTIGDFLKKSS